VSCGNVLDGVNPLAGLHAYMFGTLVGSCLTGSAFMAVHATGAMAIIMADTPAGPLGPGPLEDAQSRQPRGFLDQDSEAEGRHDTITCG